MFNSYLSTNPSNKGTISVCLSLSNLLSPPFLFSSFLLFFPSLLSSSSFLLFFQIYTYFLTNVLASPLLFFSILLFFPTLLSFSSLISLPMFSPLLFSFSYSSFPLFSSFPTNVLSLRPSRVSGAQVFPSRPGLEHRHSSSFPENIDFLNEPKPRHGFPGCSFASTSSIGAARCCSSSSAPSVSPDP